MNKISFFTPGYYEHKYNLAKEILRNTLDDYLYLVGEVVGKEDRVLLSRESITKTRSVALIDSNASMSDTMLKAAACSPHGTPVNNLPGIRASGIFPDVNKDGRKAGFFVDVLNVRGYSINGKNVVIPPAGKPVKFERQKGSTFIHELNGIKQTLPKTNHQKIELRFADLSTEQAINSGSSAKIALNFANEHHAGGGPGFHWEEKLLQFIYDCLSAQAQEESACQKTDLMASLVQLPHICKRDNPFSSMIRSYYRDKFDSTSMAYISDNHLFAVQGKSGFYSSEYLEKPRAVAFITSAAAIYSDCEDTVDCSENSPVYIDARARIETHLLAAARKAIELKKENPERPIELILGAFGCGAFVPRVNPQEYREMIANIYKRLLPEFDGLFDFVTFAVPTFGSKRETNAAVINHNVFKKILA